MYGKKFIAALMFLAVANVRAQEEEPTESELYEAAPQPEVDLDLYTDVELPEGEWDVTQIAFALVSAEEVEGAAEWAEGLAEGFETYAPSDYVLDAFAEIAGLEENGYALGFQTENLAAGILAVSWAGEKFTVLWDSTVDYSEEGVLAETINPEAALSEDGFVDNSGVGEVFGQDYDGQYWNIWSYNSEADEGESWEEGAVSVLYVEYDVETEEYSSFQADAELVAAGAASLVAAASTASLLLAIM